MSNYRWESVSLKEATKSKKGKKPSTTCNMNTIGAVPYILIDQMEGKDPEIFTDDKRISLCNKGDVLIVWDGSIGKTAHGLYGALGSTIVALTPIQVTTSFLNYFLNHKKSDIQQNSRGSGLQHINQTYFWELQIPVPPLNVQQQIVEKLDAILPKVRQVKERLEKIPVLLKKFRQSIVNSAFSGSLTEDFREKISVTGYDDYKECEKSRSKRKRLLDIDEQYIQLSIPDTWFKTNIDSISEEVVDCPHSTPKWTSSGKLCLRTTNFFPNKLSLSEVKYISEESYQYRIARLKPQKGDVLYSREGGILGIACLLDIDDDVCLGQRMMLLRSNSNMSNKFLCYYLNSPIINHHVHLLTGGSAAPHINVGDIKKYPMPLPPLAEQQEIVKRVDKLFTLADSLEAKYKKAMERIEKIEQSVLAKAFRGELVEIIL